ncbi:hypothetical protein [Pseudomonas defluvii]
MATGAPTRVYPTADYLAHPRKGRYGLIDYEKVFTPDSSQDVFALRGIDRERGAMVLVRPDQFIAHVLPLDGYEELEAFLRPIFSC